MFISRLTNLVKKGKKIVMKFFKNKNNFILVQFFVTADSYCTMKRDRGKKKSTFQSKQALFNLFAS